MIADRKGQAATDRPVSLKGAIHKNLSARASRFLRQRFGAQIWPSLTLPVRPVGGVCARPRFLPNTCVFGQTLGRFWGRDPM